MVGEERRDGGVLIVVVVRGAGRAAVGRFGVSAAFVGGPFGWRGLLVDAW